MRESRPRDIVCTLEILLRTGEKHVCQATGLNGQGAASANFQSPVSLDTIEPQAYLLAVIEVPELLM